MAVAMIYPERMPKGTVSVHEVSKQHISYARTVLKHLPDRAKGVFSGADTGSFLDLDQSLPCQILRVLRHQAAQAPAGPDIHNQVIICRGHADSSSTGVRSLSNDVERWRASAGVALFKEMGFTPFITQSLIALY